MTTAEIITSGKTALGIEFGSTRIKAVLIGPDRQPIASGAHDWHDNLLDGVWTYSLDQIHQGLTSCYQALKRDVKEKYGVTLTGFAGMGVSAMMHGYLPFDREMNLLVPFRTWRNTITAPAAKALTELMNFNIPQRWSIAHLEQAMMNGEAHVKDIAHLTTLAGYVHYLLTGKKVLGVGDAAGVFPIDSAKLTYDESKLNLWQNAHADAPWQLRGILPDVLCAGEPAGTLTKAGAKLLDPEGDLLPGAVFCPPEGDAGTGMTATNSVAVRTGNVSAGTSIFAMIVLEKPLSELHEEIDMVATPSGDPVAMVHCNTCTSDLNAWVKLLAEAAKLFGASFTTDQLYTALFQKALEGAPDCGGLTAYNYFSGEPITGTSDGVPLFTRRPELPMSLADFMRAQINSALATLSVGMEILTCKEHVAIDSVLGHGGLFKTPEVGQRLLAAAIGIPVTVMETAGEGGAWGIALLADYTVSRKAGEKLGDWLKANVFAGMNAITIEPKPEDIEGFEAFIKRYLAALPAEMAACSAMRS